jgi:hypothetical protein
LVIGLRVAAHQAAAGVGGDQAQRQAGHDEVAGRVHQVIVLLDDGAFLVAPVQAVFAEPVLQGAEDLEAPRRQALPDIEQAGLDAIVGLGEKQPTRPCRDRARPTPPRPVPAHVQLWKFSASYASSLAGVNVWHAGSLHSLDQASRPIHVTMLIGYPRLARRAGQIQTWVEANRCTGTTIRSQNHGISLAFPASLAKANRSKALVKTDYGILEIRPLQLLTLKKLGENAFAALLCRLRGPWRHIASRKAGREEYQSCQ